MGRSQGPAVTKGNLFLLFLIVLAAGRATGAGVLIHARSPSHSTLSRTHVYPIVMRGGQGAPWLVGAGVWHGFEVFPAIGRFGG